MDVARILRALWCAHHRLDLFVKQHAFIDVMAGLFLAAIGYVVVYVIIGRRRDRLVAARTLSEKKE